MTVINNFTWSTEYLTTNTTFHPGEIFQMLSPDPNSSTGDLGSDSMRLAAGASVRASTSTKARGKQPDLPGFPRAQQDPVHPHVFLGHALAKPSQNNPAGLQLYIIKSLPMHSFSQLAIPAHLPDFQAEAKLLGVAPKTRIGQLQVPVAKASTYQRPAVVLNRAGVQHEDITEPYVRLQAQNGRGYLASETHIMLRPAITRAVVNSAHYSLKVRYTPLFEPFVPR